MCQVKTSGQYVSSLLVVPGTSGQYVSSNDNAVSLILAYISRLKQNVLCVNKSLDTISEADLSVYA